MCFNTKNNINEDIKITKPPVIPLAIPLAIKYLFLSARVYTHFKKWFFRSTDKVYA
ncbi:hypothetical protein [Clostridium botulinum]|uniref:hypothetical protein n=1 Tax=Clostridium botulinum TaxID=1491 RepID=UPI0015C3B754|nr:hypothetical protein [Clostridium botulinum]